MSIRSRILRQVPSFPSIAMLQRTKTVADVAVSTTTGSPEAEMAAGGSPSKRARAGIFKVGVTLVADLSAVDGAGMRTDDHDKDDTVNIIAMVKMLKEGHIGALTIAVDCNACEELLQKLLGDVDIAGIRVINIGEGGGAIEPQVEDSLFEVLIVAAPLVHAPPKALQADKYNLMIYQGEPQVGQYNFENSSPQIRHEIWGSKDGLKTKEEAKKVLEADPRKKSLESGPSGDCQVRLTPKGLQAMIEQGFNAAEPVSKYDLKTIKTLPPATAKFFPGLLVRDGKRGSNIVAAEDTCKGLVGDSMGPEDFAQFTKVHEDTMALLSEEAQAQFKAYEAETGSGPIATVWGYRAMILAVAETVQAYGQKCIEAFNATGNIAAAVQASGVTQEDFDALRMKQYKSIAADWVKNGCPTPATAPGVYKAYEITGTGIVQAMLACEASADVYDAKTALIVKAVAEHGSYDKGVVQEVIAWSRKTATAKLEELLVGAEMMDSPEIEGATEPGDAMA